MMAGHGRQNGDGDLVLGAAAEAGLEQIEEDEIPGADLGHAVEIAGEQGGGRRADADHGAGKPAARRRVAARTAPSRSSSATSSISDMPSQA